MKMVVLDSYTLNPGDLSWEPLKKLVPCEFYDRCEEDEVVLRSRDAEMMLTNKVPITRNDIQALPKLQYIGVTATGYNIVDVAAARERKITVTNVPAYGTRSVAQATIALLLEFTNHAGHHAQTVRDGKWSKCPDFCYWDYPLIELDGLTLGVVGFGRIGRAVAELGAAFGMKVLVHSRKRPTDLSPQMNAVDLDTLFRESDVITLHCPLTPETNHMVNAKQLSLMKPSAFLLNTSRGQLIDELALAEALNSGGIAGAGLDVLSVEPPPADNPLLRAKNCIITPHQAWATRAARSRLLDVSMANVRAFLAGKPQNVVS
jgi:glycerate dehydrogenase